MKRLHIKSKSSENGIEEQFSFFKKYPWIHFPLFITIGLGILGLFILLIFTRDLPSLTQLEHYDPLLISRIYSADGKVLKELHAGERRTQVPLDRMPRHLIEATIATEDRRFYQHWGLDLRRIFKSAYVDLISMSIKEGASTLTQQVARMLYLTLERTWTRKIKETFTSLQIERNYSKDEILEMFLNQSHFGHGTWGVQAASKLYFNKDVEELNIEESALLIGMLPSPATYSPYWHPENTINRRNIVLSCMVECTYLTQSEFDSLRNLDLLVVERKKQQNTIAPYFCEYVRLEMEKRYGLGIYTDGLSIHTPLDTRIQACADSAVNGFIPGREKLLWKRIIEKKQFLKWLNPPIEDEKEIQKFLADTARVDSILREHATLQVALTAINPTNGHILAMIGGRDFSNDKFNRATQAKRQPGSAFKPIVYTAAIDNGYPTSFELLNQPVVLFMVDGSRWSPHNIDMSTGGLTTLREALRRSLNLVSVRLIQEVINPQMVVNYAKRFGFSTTIQPYDAIALGVSTVIPIEMTAAYAIYANRGVYVEPTAILRVEDKNGNLIEEFIPERKEIISEATAYIMTDLLATVINQGTGGSARWKYNFTRPAAGKTGTTNEFTDAWFLGYTPQITAGVWVGFDKDISMGDGQAGASVGVPIWAPFMRTVYDSLKLPWAEFDEPQGITRLKICGKSKKIATESCPEVIEEIFLSKYAPADTCEIHASPFQKKASRNRVVF